MNSPDKIRTIPGLFPVMARLQPDYPTGNGQTATDNFRPLSRWTFPCDPLE